MTRDPAPDGRPATVITLRNTNGMQVVVMDIGATWLSCRVPLAGSGSRELLLGQSSMPDFLRQQAYMGATVGRYANRIAGGKLHLAGRDIQLSLNQGKHCLHGGREGFDRRRWEIEAQSADSVTFSLYSPDGDQGFPGNVQASVTYTLTADNQVVLRYRARTDQATPLNLTNHAYFNLQGADVPSGETQGADARAHHLYIAAEQFLPTGADGIPLGDFADVRQTGFDFTQRKCIHEDFLRDLQQQQVRGYDHSFIFAPSRDKRQPVAQLISADGRVQMSVLTDKPALQLYTGNWLGGTPDRRGGHYADFAGVALETQYLPDAPNRPQWGRDNGILAADQEYSSCTTYAFTFV
ncbi:MAG: galactose-1-epimerase [Plesiomonas shigelloides]